ncbi:MAG: phytanoyl-CoA dioxygenase family protein [Acidimicrobiia bacterium]|nr:phytanoyl-CoA dioxygenase family protein [Acidimicrobiia bacterium]
MTAADTTTDPANTTASYDTPGLDEARVAAALADIAEQGYTVLSDVIASSLMDEILEELRRLEVDLGITEASNDFEGRQTRRIYNLLAHGEVFTRIPVHPGVLPVVEGVLDRGCLVSSLSSIDIGPGETPQPIHSDDQLIPLPKPHPPLVCNTMWALTDFTEANGATRIIPGSHLRDHSPNPLEHYDTIPAEMERGSVLVWDGALWHGGGANSTEDRRVGIAMNYCAGYIRQQENQQLGIPREVARTFGTRLRQLVGYSAYNGLIGHIELDSPAKLLDGDDGQHRMVWDA